MKPSITIRPAAPGDADLASQLIHLSMHKLAEYLFGDARKPVNEILRGLYVSRYNRFSWTTAVVAEDEGKPVGMLFSFPGNEIIRRELIIGAILLKLCGLDMLKIALRALSIADGVEAYQGEYHLANLAVLPEFQGIGTGSSLLENAESKARQAGQGKCSLIVNTENTMAKRLYERFGYRVDYTKTFPALGENTYAGYHRMVKELS